MHSGTMMLLKLAGAAMAATAAAAVPVTSNTALMTYELTCVRSPQSSPLRARPSLPATPC